MLSMHLLIGLIAIALAFDFLNGLHDAANSIATVVSTRVLSPVVAVFWAAFFNFIAFLVFGLHVANTMGKGIIDANIVDRDIVFLTPREPRPRDIVAALIDGESTLKRFLVQRGQPFLRAENPRYPDLLPATELVIQGVMIGLLRTQVN